MLRETVARAAVPITAPFSVGRYRFPSPIVLILATIGTVLLLVVVVYRWPQATDELSYWIGARRLIEGVPLYDPSASAVDPYAYRYPPIVAQALVPIASLIPAAAFSLAYAALLLACLWWIAGRSVLIALALVAFPPVAVELWFRNVHLLLAVLLVAAVRGRPALYPIAAAIKIAPGLGVLFLAVRRAWRALAVALIVGLLLLVASVALSPAAWLQFIDISIARGLLDESGFVGLPYALRVFVAVVLVLVAGRSRPAIGDPLFVVAVTLALPTLWVTALSTLVAIVPMIRQRAAPRSTLQWASR